MHCFTGTVEQAQQALERGFHLGFGGVLTFPKAEELRDAARATPDDRLLVETDCPYLAPVPHRGKRNEPAFVVDTARRLAEVRGHNFGSHRGAHDIQLREADALNWFTSNEFRQAGAGPHRERDFRPDPGRSGAGGEADQPRNRSPRWSAVTAIGQYLQSAAANGCGRRCC